MALISPHIPTPTFTFIDYDFIKKVGLDLTDVQCRPFRYIFTVQCVQDGKITDNFRINALVAADLYSLLDAHCVVGAKMRERIARRHGHKG